MCLLLYRQGLSVWTVETLLPPCKTFWDVVLGNIVNSVTLLLHKAKNAIRCRGFGMLLSDCHSAMLTPQTCCRTAHWLVLEYAVRQTCKVG